MTELHAVDERIVGKKPKSLGFAEAAGFPLTSIMVWEILFDRFHLKEGNGKGDTLLVIGGAEGVGSILICRSWLCDVWAPATQAT